MAVTSAVTAIYYVMNNYRSMREFTKMPKRAKNILIVTLILFAILLLVDRYYWAQISQWREDQATNLWLGYTAGIGEMPVGLMSSEDIPNPNGMVLWGFLLSALPNLLSVSFFLGILQIILLVLFGGKLFSWNWQYFLLATIPPLSSVLLRSTSVEFWNQYTITLINIFFIYWALKYLENASLWNLPPITILILLAPSLYLAGIVNAVVMTLLTIGIIAYKRPNMNHFWAVFIIISFLILSSLLITWLPYFQIVSLKQIIGYNKTTINPAGFQTAFKHADPRILSSATQILLMIANQAYLFQALFAFATFFSMFFVAVLKGISSSRESLKINLLPARVVVLSGLFISLSYALSAWLGGPVWLNNERTDQTVQFLPMFLFFIFLLPASMMTSGRAERIISRLCHISLMIFAAVNLLCGFMIIRDHLQYRGNVLSEADVPLINKMQAVDFIAKDWEKYSSSNIIPVDYDLGGNKWDWVPKFGRKLTDWYPAPMTQGRSFDYELLRSYGLTNQQEGIQLRTFGNGRYLVTYAFEDPPQIEKGQITHYIFGRLRVSIVEK
jgi:hypothetical protein